VEIVDKSAASPQVGTSIRISLSVWIDPDFDYSPTVDGYWISYPQAWSLMTTSSGH
jgi:hypothetical protein